MDIKLGNLSYLRSKLDTKEYREHVLVSEILNRLTKYKISADVC